MGVRKEDIKRLMCDFETTTTSNDCRVWAWAIYNIDTLEKYKMGLDITSFMLELYDLSLYNQLEIYFHNLGFDIEFILPYLFKNGFKWVNDKKIKNTKTFNTLVTEQGQWYQMKIKFGGKNKLITIKDSLKIIPLKVGVISKAYNIPQLKGEIDYNKYREIGYKLDQNEINYLWNDVEIVGKALNKTFNEGLEKITMASNAMYDYKNIQYGFKFLFPQLDGEIDNKIRKAYKGGYTYVNKQYQDKIVYNGQTFDVNSLYPYCMYQFPLPYDKPKHFKGKYKHDDVYNLYIQRLKFNFEVKPGYTPIIQTRGKFNRNDHEYLEKSGFDRLDVWYSSIDLELIKRHYNIWNVEYIEGYKFKSQKDMFKDYIDKWSKVKKESTGGKRQIAKLMLNSLYGKFAQRRGTVDKITGVAHSILKKPYINDNGVIKYETIENKERKTIYTPVAVFITAYARQVLINAIDMVGYDRFVYCDTDSIHILGNENPDIEIHDKKLGAWKRESYWTKGKFIRPKTYIEDEIHGNANKLLVKVAGMPDNLKEKITFDNFERGYTDYGKLIPKRVKGGVVLEPTTFTIK